MSSNCAHEPVMLAEVLDLLNVRSGGTYIDCTGGSGGHSLAMACKAGGAGRLLCLDQDREAIGRIEARLEGVDARVDVVHGNFEHLNALATAKGIGLADAILMDLGVSSEQLDDGERGFSFRSDKLLDMRMDQTVEKTAADLLADLDVRELATIIRTYGEERHAGRIARAIERRRRDMPVRTTGELAAIIEQATGSGRGRIHPATRTFQALRIAVNRELEVIPTGIESALLQLKPGGRLGVITFHSLEDRIVKRLFVAHEGRHESLHSGGSRWVGREPRVRRVTRKPVIPALSEVAYNPRARSAKLRVVERLSEG